MLQRLVSAVSVSRTMERRRTALASLGSFGRSTEEMADVEIMLEQLRIIYGNRSEVDTIKAEKLLRLSERLEVLCR